MCVQSLPRGFRKCSKVQVGTFWRVHVGYKYIYIHLEGGDLNLVDISNHDVFNTEIRRSLEQRSYKHQTWGWYLEKWHWFPVPLGNWGGRMRTSQTFLWEQMQDLTAKQIQYCFAILIRDLKNKTGNSYIWPPWNNPQKWPSNCLIYHALSGYHPLSYTYEVFWISRV